jgi:hypothetical protein
LADSGNPLQKLAILSSNYTQLSAGPQETNPDVMSVGPKWLNEEAFIKGNPFSE